MADVQRGPTHNMVMKLSDCSRPCGVCLLPNAENSTQDLLEQVISEQDSLGQALTSLSDKLAKLEKCLEETDHRIEALEAKMVSTQGCVVKHSTLMRELAAGHRIVDHRLETLENKVRARNLRVTGVPAAVREMNLIPFIENLVPAALDLNGKADPVRIENAYRLPARNTQEGHSSTVLITLSDLRHRQRILKASQASQSADFLGHKISFFPDLSPATYARRKRFVALRQLFLKEGVQAYVLYPAKLKVVHQGKNYVFQDHVPASQLLDRIRKGSCWKETSPLPGIEIKDRKQWLFLWAVCGLVLLWISSLCFFE